MIILYSIVKKIAIILLPTKIKKCNRDFNVFGYFDKKAVLKRTALKEDI